MGGKSSTQTSTVQIPPEVMEQYRTVIGRANELTQKPFEAYSQDPTAFVAPLTSTQQAGIANINAIQGMAQPSIGQGQDMIMQGIGAAAPIQGQSMQTAAEGRGMGTQLFGQSLDTAAQGTGVAGDIYGRVLPAIQQSAQTGAAYGAKADPFLSNASAASTPLMGQGAGLTMAGLGAGAGMTGQAANYLQGATQAIDPTEFSGKQIDKYMSPYLKNVVEAQQALQQEEAAAQRSALKGNAIAAGAFGGDRGGIAQANLARQQGLANQATLANLLQGGYGQALGAFQQQQGVDLAAQQANRQAQQFGSQQAAALGQQMFGQNLAAGTQLANIGQALFGQNITQGQALAALGQQLYGQGLGAATAAAGVGSNIAAMKQQEAALQQQAAQGVFGQAAQEAAIQQAAGNNIFNMANQGGMNYANLGIAGQTAATQGAQAQLAAGQIEQQTEQAAKSAMYNQFLQQQGFPYQQLGFLGNVSMGIGSQSGGTTTTTGGSYSDRRLKEDIRKVGETFDGQPIYSFRYKGEEKTQLGLMAQEVEKMHPDAVGERHGYLTVDYHDATEDAAKRGHFADGGLVPNSMGGAVTPLNYREGFEWGGETGSEPGTWSGETYDPNGSGTWNGETWVPNTSTPAPTSNTTTPATTPTQPAPTSSTSTTTTTTPSQPYDPAKIDPRIVGFYQKYLGRTPDAAGAQSWQAALDNGMSITDIEKGFIGSGERSFVNSRPMVYDETKFGTPSAPTTNRYGFYSGNSTGSSFTPEAIAARKNTAMNLPTASGKGTQSGSTYTPATGSPTATGKGPMTGGARYGSYSPAPMSPTATGKGPATNAYTGTNYTGYSGSPTATGKGPATGAYANGGRVPYAGGGASELKNYIDMMSDSPKGLAMSHAGIFKMPGERADITKYSEGMLRGRSNVPQPTAQQRPQQNLLKEAADFGTNVQKIAAFGEQAKTKLDEWTKPKGAPGGTTGGTTPGTTSGGNTPAVGKIGAQTTSEQFGPPMPPTKMADVQPDQMGDAMRSASSMENPFDVASMPDNFPQVDEASGDLFSGIGSLFAANGGRIKKFDGGPTYGTGKSDDPSEGAYDPIGPSIDMGEVKVPQASNVPKPGRSGGGGGGGGSSMLGTVGQVAGLASTAFSVGKALVTFLPMMFSDERLKKHIKPVGRLYDGQTVYRFDMGGETKIGLIAQEVEKHVPDAVGLAGKHKAVDYEIATAKSAKRGHFYDGGPAIRDISTDPVKDAIQMAALPSNALTLPDMSPKADVASDAAPVSAPAPAQTAGLNPTEIGGLKPTPERELRHQDFFEKRIVPRESSSRQFDPSGGVLRGAAGEEGISQIRPAAAKEAAAYLGVEYDPERVQTDKDYNMKLGKAYFNIQLDNFGGDPMIAAAAYNAGPGRVKLAMQTAKEKGGDVLDYLPVSTVKYLADLSDAAQGAHQGLLERQQKVEAQTAQGAGPTVIDTPKATGLAGATASASPGLGAAMGKNKDWEILGAKVLPDAVPKSADFWVPLIAAVGGMLGARAPNAANAIGAGLMAGATAYMGQKEMEERVANQAAQRDIQYKQLGLTEREVAIKEQQERIKRLAAEAAAKALSGDITPPTATMPKVDVQPVKPFNPNKRVRNGEVVDGGEGGEQPETNAPKVPAPKMPAANSDFWNTVDPQSNPFILNRTADRYEKAGAAAGMAGDGATMKSYLDQAKIYRDAARTIRTSGEVSLLDGTVVAIPGFAETKAALEAAKETATLDVKRKFEPYVTPGGVKISPNPEAKEEGAAVVAPPKPPADRPNKAQFDAQSGKLATAIPAAPEGGGFYVPPMRTGDKLVDQGDLNKEISKNDGLFQKDFLEKLPKTDVAISRYKSMANAFKLTQSGATAEALAAWSAFAESYGMPDLALRITNNDPAAVELIKKEAPNMVLDTLAAANPRFAQSEFMSLKDQGTPSPDKLPRTNFQMVTDGLAMLERQKAFSRDWQQAQKEGWQSPSAFWNAWSDANPMSQFQTAARRQIGNFKGMEIPAISEWTPGAIYVAPDKMDAKQAETLMKRGVKPGQLFKFNGWDAPKAITPVDASKGFSAYLE